MTEKKGVDWKYRKLIGNLYISQKVRLKIEEEFLELEVIGRGVRQECSALRNRCENRGRGDKRS